MSYPFGDLSQCHIKGMKVAPADEQELAEREVQTFLVTDQKGYISAADKPDEIKAMTIRDKQLEFTLGVFD